MGDVDWTIVLMLCLVVCSLGGPNIIRAFLLNASRRLMSQAHQKVEEARRCLLCAAPEELHRLNLGDPVQADIFYTWANHTAVGGATTPTAVPLGGHIFNTGGYRSCPSTKEPAPADTVETNPVAVTCAHDPCTRRS